MRNLMRLNGCILLATLLITIPASLPAQSPKKIVLIAGVKTHGPGEHEYLKTVRLIKVMLDHATNLRGVKTEIHFNGWPANPATLDDADAIVVYADGSDAQEDHDPLFTGDHWSIIQKQMKRGCGLVVLHYSTFAPARLGPQFIEWAGGYFDYETGKLGASGRDAWYSDIKTETAMVKPVAGHPITRGLTPFDLHEEFYFKIHFQENDQRFKPVLNVSISGVEKVQTIAWSVERKDGGRGFGFTGGHFYNNWEVANYRKLLLNAITWTAGAQVPANGVESRYYADDEVDRLTK